ncbi:MAG: hypothetical protein ACTSWP_01585 [Candidatus Freyarchaeota archaeon]
MPPSTSGSGVKLKKHAHLQWQLAPWAAAAPNPLQDIPLKAEATGTAIPLKA